MKLNIPLIGLVMSSLMLISGCKRSPSLDSTVAASQEATAAPRALHEYCQSVNGPKDRDFQILVNLGTHNSDFPALNGEDYLDVLNGDYSPQAMGSTTCLSTSLLGSQLDVGQIDQLLQRIQNKNADEMTEGDRVILAIHGLSQLVRAIVHGSIELFHKRVGEVSVSLAFVNGRAYIEVLAPDHTRVIDFDVNAKVDDVLLDLQRDIFRNQDMAPQLRRTLAGALTFLRFGLGSLWAKLPDFQMGAGCEKLGDVGSDMVGLQCEAHIGVTNSAGDMIGLRLPTAPLVLLGDRVLPKNPNPTLRDQFLRSTLKSTVMMIGYSCTAIGEGQEHPETNLCRGGEAGVQFTYLFGNDGDKVYDDVTINFKNLSVAFLYHQDRIASIGDALNPSLTAKCVYSPDREANCFSQGNCLSTRKLFNPDEEGLKQFCEAKPDRFIRDAPTNRQACPFQCPYTPVEVEPACDCFGGMSLLGFRYYHEYTEWQEAYDNIRKLFSNLGEPQER